MAQEHRRVTFQSARLDYRSPTAADPTADLPSESKCTLNHRHESVVMSLPVAPLASPDADRAGLRGAFAGGNTGWRPSWGSLTTPCRSRARGSRGTAFPGWRTAPGRPGADGRRADSWAGGQGRRRLAWAGAAGKDRAGLRRLEGQQGRRRRIAGRRASPGKEPDDSHMIDAAQNLDNLRACIRGPAT